MPKHKSVEFIKTYDDYTNGKMDVSLDCVNKDGKIKPNDYFGKDYITVIKAGSKTDIKKR